MEILDPDLWNDDGTPKRPTKAYMDSLNEMQTQEALNPEVQAKREKQLSEAYRLFREKAHAERVPDVGDIVHFWDDEAGRCRAAMVMEGTVGTDTELRVHFPHEGYQDWCCGHDESRGRDSWHWPCGA